MNSFCNLTHQRWKSCHTNEIPEGFHINWARPVFLLSLHLHQLPSVYCSIITELVQQGLLETATKCLTTSISMVPKRITVLLLMGKHLFFLAAVNLTGSFPGVAS